MLPAAWEPAFTLARRLMRVLRTIIQPFVLSVLDAHQDLSLRGTIAGKFVGDDDPWHVLAAFEQFAEELCLGGARCSFIAPALDEDIQHVPVLVNSAPEVGRFALDG